MTNFEILTVNNVSHNFNTCFAQLKTLMPHITMAQRLAVTTWWTSRLPKPARKVVLPYATSILKRNAP